MSTRSGQQYKKKAKEFVQGGDLHIVTGEARETGEERGSVKAQTTQVPKASAKAATSVQSKDFQKHFQGKVKTNC